MDKTDFGLASGCLAKAARRQEFSREVDENRKDQKDFVTHFSEHPPQFPKKPAASHFPVGYGSHVGWQKGSRADFPKSPGTEVHGEKVQAAGWVQGLEIVSEQRDAEVLGIPFHLPEGRRGVGNPRGDSSGGY